MTNGQNIKIIYWYKRVIVIYMNHKLWTKMEKKLYVACKHVQKCYFVHTYIHLQ